MSDDMVGSAAPFEFPIHTFTATFDDTTVHLTAVLVDGEPWFHGRAVAAQLGFKYLDKILHSHVDADDKAYLEDSKLPTGVAAAQYPHKDDLHISEDGLAALIADSKAPYKREYKHWFRKVVLPKLAQCAQATPAEHEAVSQSDMRSTTEPMPATEPVLALEPAQVDWERHRQKLEALAAARSLAKEFGMPLGESHRRAVSDAINEVVLPAGHEQKDMIGAADFLRRKGHTPEETFRLATEFGKALKHAWMSIHHREPVTNAQEFEAATNDVRMYHVLHDGPFLEAVYTMFTTRSLYISNCAGHEQAKTQMKVSVETALQNARGFAKSAQRANNSRCR